MPSTLAGAVSFGLGLTTVVRIDEAAGTVAALAAALALAFGAAASALAPGPVDRAEPVTSRRCNADTGFLPSSMTAAADTGDTALVGEAAVEEVVAADAGDVVVTPDGVFGPAAFAVCEAPAAAAFVTGEALEAVGAAVEALSPSATNAEALVCLSSRVDAPCFVSFWSLGSVAFADGVASFSKALGAAFTSGAPGLPGMAETGAAALEAGVASDVACTGEEALELAGIVDIL